MLLWVRIDSVAENQSRHSDSTVAVLIMSPANRLIPESGFAAIAISTELRKTVLMAFCPSPK